MAVAPSKLLLFITQPPNRKLADLLSRNLLILGRSVMTGDADVMTGAGGGTTGTPVFAIPNALRELCSGRQSRRWRDVGVLDHLAPLVALGVQAFGEELGRATDQDEAELLQPPAQARIAQGLVHRGVQLGDHGRRRAGPWGRARRHGGLP